ncbi:MAG: TIGR03009 domain-containing protein [Planctomycetia bacterium]|nr:TIGR03009 domain-containing protein [Planctomycetia bacterium]
MRGSKPASPRVDGTASFPSPGSCVPKEDPVPACVTPCRAGLALALVALALPQGSSSAQPPAAPAPAAAPAAPPFPQLSPEQQAALDRLLAAWEARNAAVTTWSCTFYKWEYNAWSPADGGGERLAFTESSGEIKYAAPDKGLYRVREAKQWNGETRRYEPRVGEAGEHWVCNGASIYEFRHAERQLRETKLPPEMRGKAISDGPLPFVFGAKADTLRKRYAMRLITPPGTADQIWLEALPRLQADAANFSKVELILQARDLMPFAMQIYKPGGQDRDVYQFDPRTSLIDKGLDLIRDFSKPVTPLGYTFILEDGQGAAPQPPPR